MGKTMGRTTADQKFYSVSGKRGEFKAEIDVYVTRESADAPSIQACRHAALPLADGGYVVYDRVLNRIVDGVYSGEDALQDALGVAAYYNEDSSAQQDGNPNGAALDLVYPEVHPGQNIQLVIEDRS